MRAWGDNASGQTAVPAGLANIVAVAAGPSHSLAIDAAGKLTAWGAAPAGAPSASQLAGTWMLSAGLDEDYALKTDGSLLVWGPGPGAKQKPANLPPLRMIRGGHVQAVALGLDGKVFSWGGFGGATNFVVPDSLAFPPTAVVAASLFEPFDVAVRTDEAVIQWGDTVGVTPLPFPPPLPRILDLVLSTDVGYALLAPPAGDDFAGAVPVVGDDVVLSGDNRMATVEVGEPKPLGAGAGGDSVWFKWISPRHSRGLMTLRSRSAGHRFVAYTSRSDTESFADLVELRQELRDNQGRLFPTSFFTVYEKPVWIRVETIPDPFGGGLNPGSFEIDLSYRIPYSMDAFDLSPAIAPTDKGPVEGSLLAAGMEFGETTFPPGTADIWWHWTAPADLGPGGTRATVSVTGNQSQLGLRILEGKDVYSLVPVPADSSVVGLTAIASFDAVAGHRYEFAVGGLPFDNFGAVENRAFTKVRLDLTASPVSIRQTQVAVVANEGDRTARISGSMTVKNQSEATTGALQLRLYRRPGYALNNSNDSPAGDLVRADLADVLVVSTNGLAPGEVATVPVDMTLPPSDGQLSSGDQGIGWGGYAVLEELAATKSGAGRWRSVDRRLLGTGPWPYFDLSNVGPGGGAIRIDSGSGAPALDLVELSSVSVGGPDQLAGGAGAAFTASATWTDGVTEAIDPDWNVDGPATISAAGVVDTAAVTRTTDLTVRASYASGGVDVVGTRKVRVTVTPLQWGAPRFANGGYSVKLGGRPGIRVRVERSEDLRAWTRVDEQLVPPAGTVDVPVTPVPGRAAEFIRAVVLP